MKQILTNWENQTQLLADNFMSKYFCKGKKADVDFFWVADEIGGVLSVSDYFFDLSDVIDALRYNIPINKLFSFYDYQLKCYEEKKEKEYNMKNWAKLK